MGPVSVIPECEECGHRSLEKAEFALEAILQINEQERPLQNITLRSGEHHLGRSPDCAVRLACGSVSRMHAKIVINEHSVYIEDLGSTNGTLHHETNITAPFLINDSCEFKLGNSFLKIEVKVCSRKCAR